MQILTSPQPTWFFRSLLAERHTGKENQEEKAQHERDLLNSTNHSVSWELLRRASTILLPPFREKGLPVALPKPILVILNSGYQVRSLMTELAHPFPQLPDFMVELGAL